MCVCVRVCVRTRAYLCVCVHRYLWVRRHVHTSAHVCVLVCAKVNKFKVFGLTTSTGKTAESALYFSRSVMPFPRTRAHQPKLHIGLYAFSPASLQAFAGLEPSSLAVTESLEQLTALEAGERVAVMMVERAAPGIDTIDDYNAFVSRQKV